MPRLIKKRSVKAGLPPGTLIPIGEKKAEKVKVTVLDYDEDNFQEKEVQRVEECFPFKDTATVTWINIDGVHDVEVLERLGQCFGLHPLVLEDILNTDQRPKMEDFGDYLYMALKMIYYDEASGGAISEHVSLILGSNFVLSFQEREGDVFNVIRDRIRTGKGRIRKQAADYLVYALMDAIVDNYFFVMEKFGEVIEEMEDKLVADPKPAVLHGIHSLKREVIFLRKAVWPLRDAISAMERAETPLVKKGTAIYLRDVHDHAVQVIDTVETFRDILAGTLDVYLSSVSNRMNEVMKVLTIIATIFIPLTFIAGIYGMNFKKMPEIDWWWGYPTVLCLMLAIGLLMLWYFRRKKWL